VARYVILEVYPPEMVQRVVSSVVDLANRLLGIRSIRGSIIPIEYHRNRAIIRVTTRFLPYLRAAVFMLRKVENHNVLILTIRVTGSVRKARAQARSIPFIISQ